MPAKLAAIGDSMTQGVSSGCIHRTEFSYPALIAQCLGEDNFRRPEFTGEGGLPVNLEQILRLLVDRYGSKVNWHEVVPAILSVRSLLDRVEDYWERGEGSQPSLTGPIHHNLGVLGFQLGDCDTLTEAICRRVMPEPQDNPIRQIPDFAMYRSARRTLNPRFDNRYENLSQITAAQAIAQAEGGIENLIVWLGANNCLGTVIDLKIKWSNEEDISKLAHNRTCNLWQPEHFQKLLDRVAPQIDAIGATNVFIGTIPRVTIPPISRGVTPGKTTNTGALDQKGYYEFYTHFWVWDEEFSKAPHKYPYLTGEEVRKIDSVIDAYNQAIKKAAQRYGWHIVDFCEKLDQLAIRRLQGQIQYQFPQGLIDALKANPKTKHRVSANGQPLLDTRYIQLLPNEPDPDCRFKGGLIGLDGFHPTRVCYGLIAHEVLEVMKKVGVTINQPTDWWDKIVQSDTLLTDPPPNLEHLNNTLGFLYYRTPLPKLIEIVSGRLL
jgi:hypothetical protein